MTPVGFQINEWTFQLPNVPPFRRLGDSSNRLSQLRFTVRRQVWNQVWRRYIGHAIMTVRNLERTGDAYNS